jgi:uncharacterized membrane protein YuzA (DUF378 family)
MKVLHIIALILLVIGGLNWGLVGTGGFVGGNWNVVNLLLGAWPVVEWIVYILVGLSALWILFTHKKSCRMCMSSKGSMPTGPSAGM